MEKFPKLFGLLNRQDRNQSDFLFESDLATDTITTETEDESDEPKTKLLTQITQWLREQPHTKSSRRTIGSLALDNETITCIINAVEKNKVNGHSFCVCSIN